MPHKRHKTVSKTPQLIIDNCGIFVAFLWHFCGIFVTKTDSQRTKLEHIREQKIKNN